MIVAPNSWCQLSKNTSAFGHQGCSHTSVRNPQSNAVCKRLHQSVGNALRIFLSQAIPFNITNVAKLVDSALATALHASHAAIHCTLGMTPGAIIFFFFNRDMF
jgi:hypothetical protein